MQLRDVRDELVTPAAASVRAEAGLQPGGDMTDSDAVAPVALLATARVARLEPACSASEDRVENDAGSGREPGCIVEGLADNFVTRNERHRHDGAQIQRGMAGQRGEIAAADAGQARAHTDPLVESQRWRVAMHEAQWRQGPGK